MVQLSAAANTNHKFNSEFLDTMEHERERNGAGENLAYFSPPRNQCQGQKKPNCVQCREMVKDWYDEIKNFDFDTGQSHNHGVVFHFTQVVWKETTDLGMATAMSADKFFTVARYKPRGNIGLPEDFIENVPKPLTRDGTNGSPNVP